MHCLKFGIAAEARATCLYRHLIACHAYSHRFNAAAYININRPFDAHIAHFRDTILYYISSCSNIRLILATSPKKLSNRDVGRASDLREYGTRQDGLAIAGFYHFLADF